MIFPGKGKDIPIAGISKAKESADIYNFEVNPYHTYVADGFVVHNVKLFAPEPDPDDGPR